MLGRHHQDDVKHFLATYGFPTNKPHLPGLHPGLLRGRSKANPVDLYQNSWICLRCLDKFKKILPNGALMVIYHGKICKTSPSTDPSKPKMRFLADFLVDIHGPLDLTVNVGSSACFVDDGKTRKNRVTRSWLFATQFEKICAS